MSYHTPARAPKSKSKWVKALDWKMIAALTAYALVSILGIGWFHAQNQGDRLITNLVERQDEIDLLQSRIIAVNERARAERIESAEERKQAAAERAKLLRQQGILLELVRGLGAEVPPGMVEGFVPGEPGSDDRRSASSSSASSKSPEPKPSKSPEPKPSKSPEPKPSKGPEPKPNDLVEDLLEVPCGVPLVDAC